MNKLLAPTTLFLIIVVTGYLAGKIKICNISLDLSAILIVAVITGYFISKFYPAAVDDNFNNAMSLFSKTGTALFVGAVGISSGSSITKGSNKKNVMCFLLGAFMACIGFLVTKMIDFVDINLDKSLLMGILCGALTSTPGLASICESGNIAAELATVGYGASYLFGVIGVVLFVQYLMKKAGNPGCKTSALRSAFPSTGLESLIVICLVGIIGQLIGSYEIPYVKITLGNTGGILLCGILAGFLIKKFAKSTEISNQPMTVYRNLGLLMFFVGTGISSGQRLNTPLNMKWFVYGALITAITILAGYVVCCYILKNNIEDCMLMVAGGMTSTPAIGVIMKNSNRTMDLSSYSAAYLGALLTITLGVRLLF